MNKENCALKLVEENYGNEPFCVSVLLQFDTNSRAAEMSIECNSFHLEKRRPYK